MSITTQPTLTDKIVIKRGGYVARFVASDTELRRTQALRHQCFVDAAGGPARADGLEFDGFDALCDHVMIEDSAGSLRCSFRLMRLRSGGDLGASYSAQYYDLERLSGYNAPMLELGRFCVAPDVRDPDVVRLAWGMLAAVVDQVGAGMLFGCSSFAGTAAAPYRAAFDLLAARHQAPTNSAPERKAPEVVAFEAPRDFDHAAALGQVPTLLKTYLSMGGWVSDHAVVDRELNTLHVFTGLEIASIPAARAKALRAIAGI